MTDLIERLRKHREYQRSKLDRRCDNCGNVPGNWHPLICTEAADEIERNRKEINGLLELLRKDRAEIERLKAAIDADTKYIALADERIDKLEAVVDAAKDYRAMPHFMADVAQRLDEALAALEEADDE